LNGFEGLSLIASASSSILATSDAMWIDGVISVFLANNQFYFFNTNFSIRPMY
jgi:hypothetical protein